MFSGLSLEVPEGYTVAFGSSSDTIHLRFIHAKVSGYEFYSANGAVNGGTCLAFNVYGKDKTAPASKPVTEGSVNLLPMDAQRAYPLTSNAYHQWDYNGAPYILIAQNYFGGKTVTDIEAPILSSPAGGKMTVSVVKMNGSTVKETLKTYTLTVPSAVNREWVCFSDLEIVVPEGYTLAFGAAGDTATLAFIAMDLDGYAFYNRVGSPSGGASILFNVYGK
jgi:hypothetical protein